jgi:hypothetical protein
LTGADEVPVLAGGVFLSNWDGLTVGDLFEGIRISMPADRRYRFPLSAHVVLSTGALLLWFSILP